MRTRASKWHLSAFLAFPTLMSLFFMSLFFKLMAAVYLIFVITVTWCHNCESVMTESYLLFDNLICIMLIVLIWFYGFVLGFFFHFLFINHVILSNTESQVNFNTVLQWGIHSITKKVILILLIKHLKWVQPNFPLFCLPFGSG